MSKLQFDGQTFQVEIELNDEIIGKCYCVEAVGYLSTTAGDEVGRCVIQRYVRRAGVRSMQGDEIAGELDDHSDQAGMLGALLIQKFGAERLEGCVNRSGLLLLDSLEIVPGLRGRTLWVPLFQATLAKVTKQMRQMSDGFFLKAAPLTQRDMSPDAIRLAERKLEQLYMRCLKASRISEQDDHGVWMFAPLRQPEDS